MFKILKNLKKSALSVAIIVLLLCVQAWADLTLPDYTSKIVNVGIQQGGIENSVPEAIRKSQMNKLLIFTKDDENILSKYILISKNSLEEKEFNKYVKKYPALESEDLYIINELSKDELNELGTLMAKPLMILSNVTNEQTAEKIKEQLINTMQGMQEYNGEQVENISGSPMAATPTMGTNREEQTGAENGIEQIAQEINGDNLPIPPAIMNQMSLLELLGAMPQDQFDVMFEKIEESLNGMNDSILAQAAINSVKEEYKAIGINTDKIQNGYIFVSGLQMLGIALISMISAIVIMLLSSRVAANLGRTLRDKVFKKVMNFSTKEFREFSTASLITRSTNDIQQIQGLISMLFRVVVYAPIIGVGGFLRVLANSDTSMAWIIGFAILCVIGVVLTLFTVAMPKFKILQELVDKLNLVSREILTGLPVIRAFNTSKREEERFDKSNTDLMKANIFVNRAMSIMMPALMFVMNSIMLLIIWVGGHKVDEGIMQVGDMMAFIQYTMQIVMSFLMISMISIMLPRAAVSAKRINEVLEKDLSIANKEKIKRFKEDKKGLVEFKNVCFRYPDADEEMLTDINFTAKTGETTAIIGSTGSGKSTIVNLLPRFYDVTRGELLIDGTNIKDVPIKELRKKIGFVPQKGILFSGTIKSNIKYGNPEMSDEDMIKAVKIAQAEEFILAKEEKYDSPIAQGGNNVSGGQKQRLSIARAIAISPEILVFDDSFSALDLKTDKALRDALAKEVKGKTVIIVAQRISTIMNAEQIVVLEEGKVVGKGTHEELMKTCETYKQIAISQLSEEELNGNNSKEVD
ncbi:MAG: ATP-binding cassette domain-containing protein [Clostridia bacterium]|nr:ATP-binding cassette domain-containing protein [Clostridia bacterium]